MKGAALGSWMDFTQKTRKRLADEWINIASTRDEKKGNTNYTVPEFAFVSSIDNDSDAKAEVIYTEMKSYFDAKLAAPVPEKDDKLEPIPMKESEQEASQPERKDAIASIVSEDEDSLPF